MAHSDRITGPKPVGEGVLIFDEVKVQNGSVCVLLILDSL